MDKQRWRYSDTEPVIAPVKAETVIEIGDILFQCADGCADTDGGVFLGVAMQRSRSGDTAPIRVATAGVFEFDCDARAWKLGEKVERDGRQSVTEVAHPAYAIGRVAKYAKTPSRIVLVDIRSQIMGHSV
jgi:predicted RecA/RadA family phage recombinase